jgi:hypothetical protein
MNPATRIPTLSSTHADAHTMLLHTVTVPTHSTHSPPTLQRCAATTLTIASAAWCTHCNHKSQKTPASQQRSSPADPNPMPFNPNPPAASGLRNVIRHGPLHQTSPIPSFWASPHLLKRYRATFPGPSSPAKHVQPIVVPHHPHHNRAMHTLPTEQHSEFTY